MFNALSIYIPFNEKATYWPQLFLGITFNYGLILGWTSITEEISLVPLLLYFGAIFWTLGYDTIYGFQDIKDDEIIGLKSTSIKFKKVPNKFLIICYSIFLINLFLIGYIMKLNEIFVLMFLISVSHLYYFQINHLDIKKPSNCLKIFKSNNLLGLIIFVGLFISKL